jgi:thiosulfate reductase cytochrome b subunit
MKLPRIAKTLLLGGAAVLIVALGVQLAAARPAESPAPQASPLHPAFALLDETGANVLESGAPLSPMQTCGQCHDAAYIAGHSFHADLGLGEQTAPGQVPGGQPWDTSPGLYGKWNPLTYRYLSPAGDARPDLDNAAWVIFNAARLVGGGPAEASGVELNCFMCHLTQPNHSARIAAIQAGQGEWASTATLVGSGIVEASGTGYTWNPAAFADDGALLPAFVTIQDPTNDNCAQCHGLAHTDLETPLTLAGCALDNWQTAATGQVISAQKISLSGVNLADKSSLARAWDIHAERGVSCTDCHFSLNNPVYAQASPDGRPEHLQFDPRRLELGEYLQKPDHNLARGQSAQSTIAAELKGTMRRCEACHDARTHTDWLPYVERHIEELACETCHIPRLYAPAVQSYDWTVLQIDGQPAIQCRGVEGDAGDLTDLVTGFQPVLLQRRNIDGDTMLAPYNLVAAWYWVYDSQAGPRPVRLEDLRAAWLSGDGYAPQVLQGLDSNRDGDLSAVELRLDSPEKEALIRDRLAALGLQNPRIEGQIQPYSLNHNVTNGEWATRECQSCHADNSRLAAALKLADYLPGGVTPTFVADSNTLASAGGLSLQDGALVYAPDTSEQGLYVFGHNRVAWVDWFGALFFVSVLLGVAGHGGLRFYAALRQPRREARTKKVYLYAVYERFWHWLQTFAIVLLLLTGLIIHRPDVFGWLSFRHVVTLHNVLAAILVINAALSLFYHLASGEIRQFIPRPYGFFDQAIVQARFYLRGIFRGGAHPFEKTPAKKLNPLQQATYFGILNVLLPLQVITGALMWGVQQWPQVAGWFGGLPFLAPFHSLVAWTFGAFIVGHVYLTTTGYEPLAGIKAMVNGWEDVEDHEHHEASEATEPPVTGSSQPEADATD